jgi:hypothetical protein
MSLIAELITEQYGERCPDFDPDCWACKAWAEYDKLTLPAAESGWRDIASAPKDRPFLAYGSYLYPGDKFVTEYTMIAEFSCGDAEWPFRTHEGTHRKGFFSHWHEFPHPPSVQEKSE